MLLRVLGEVAEVEVRKDARSRSRGIVASYIEAMVAAAL
jgi:hypothetical protein